VQAHVEGKSHSVLVEPKSDRGLSLGSRLVVHTGIEVDQVKVCDPPNPHHTWGGHLHLLYCDDGCPAPCLPSSPAEGEAKQAGEDTGEVS